MRLDQRCRHPGLANQPEEIREPGLRRAQGQSRPDRRRAQYLAPHITGVEDMEPCPSPAAPRPSRWWACPWKSPASTWWKRKASAWARPYWGITKKRTTPCTCAPPSWSPTWRCISNGVRNPPWPGSPVWTPASRWRRPDRRARLQGRPARPERHRRPGHGPAAEEPAGPPLADEYACPLFVSARLGDDLSFARSDWDEGHRNLAFRPAPGLARRQPARPQRPRPGSVPSRRYGAHEARPARPARQRAWAIRRKPRAP
jgi:hypothetical protein